MKAIWNDLKSLTFEQKKELAQILKTKVGSEVFNKVEEKLIVCSTNQQTYDWVFQQSEFDRKKYLKSLDITLKKAIRIVSADLAETNIAHLNQDCWQANDWDKSFLTPPKDPTKSIVEERLLEIKNGVSFSLENMGKPSKSRGPYSNAIREFGVFFTDIFPKKSESIGTESLFSKLVTFWLNKLIGLQIEDPQRHIEKALPEKYIGK
ncbi:MAG: hypothetical protein ABGY96_10770 [bacterium]|nr:hypothetical protein [Gammaproteobacteria bacterium]HIL98345.1 hypothetical protein [Pseudomonadales bacterium]